LASFQLYPLQHCLHVVPAAQRVRRGQHASVPHAFIALLYQYVAGFRQLLHVVPRPHNVPSAHFATVGGGVGVREGLAVGISVAVPVGAEVGPRVVTGAGDGFAIGAFVGTLVGRTGATVGFTAGLANGFFVGLDDGLASFTGVGFGLTSLGVGRFVAGAAVVGVAVLTATAVAWVGVTDGAALGAVVCASDGAMVAPSISASGPSIDGDTVPRSFCAPTGRDAIVSIVATSVAKLERWFVFMVAVGEFGTSLGCRGRRSARARGL
jgi:hypothetical protein